MSLLYAILSLVLPDNRAEATQAVVLDISKAFFDRV